MDVTYKNQTDPHLSFILEFHFSPNEFFRNTVLKKEYFLKCAPESHNPYVFHGPVIVKSKGTEIEWMPEQNVTTQRRVIDDEEVEVNVDSFFNFFSPVNHTRDRVDDSKSYELNVRPYYNLKTF